MPGVFKTMLMAVKARERIAIMRRATDNSRSPDNGGFLGGPGEGTGLGDTEPFEEAARFCEKMATDTFGDSEEDAAVGADSRQDAFTHTIPTIDLDAINMDEKTVHVIMERTAAVEEALAEMRSMVELQRRSNEQSELDAEAARIESEKARHIALGSMIIAGISAMVAAGSFLAQIGAIPS